MVRVLLIINHAPDYRERFLRHLAEWIDLTVVAQPCDKDNLRAPERRGNYRYIELEYVQALGVRWQKLLGAIVGRETWDVLCVAFNPRHVSSIFYFLTHKKYWKKWVWWGSILGRNQSKLLKWFRGRLLSGAAACLVYNETVAEKLKKECHFDGVGFNNSDICRDEFRPGVFEAHSGIRLLFVGRCQPRKKLSRLVQIAETRDDVYVRLVGPGMAQLNVPDALLASGRIQKFGRTTGRDLVPHFDWADLVANPGHAGLLIMNAARHGKGIVIDIDSDHAPEHYLAEEAGQPFIRFSDRAAVDHFLDQLYRDTEFIRTWGKALQDKTREKYTVESMVAVHVDMFKKIKAGTVYGKV